MTKGMITVVGMANMEVMIVEAIMTAIMTMVAMEEVGMVVVMVVGMEMKDMVEEVTTAKVAQEVGRGGHVPVVVQVGRVEVDLVVAVVVVALVVEAGVDVVVLLEEGVAEVEVMVAMVRRSVSLVVMVLIKAQLVATQNLRGSTLITTISMGSRTPNKSGVVTTTTVTRVINSGTKTPGRSSRDGEVILYLLIGSHSTCPTRFMLN